MIGLKYTVGAFGPFTAQLYTDDPVTALRGLADRLAREDDGELRPGEGRPLYVEFEEVGNGPPDPD